MFFGYLDAGSGSLIIQAVLGGIAGIVVFGRAWKARLFNKDKDEATQEPDETPLTES